MVFDRGTSYAANLFKNALNGSFSTVYPVKIMNYGLNDQNSSTAPKGGVINAIKSYYSSSEINSQKIDQL
jgi:hypothetical protein